MKRAFDISVSAMLLLLCSPILAVILVVVRLQSSGSAIFAQTRIGKEGRPFTCYKIRTMYSGIANVPTHEVEASSITALGARLRRFKVDELPQLYNVLAGDMSLVGPRPCLPGQVELIEARRRLGVFKVRPGVTGLAQVNGIDMSTPDRLAEVDALYVQDQSFLGDLGLLWATLRGRGMGIDRVVRNNR